MNRLSLIFLLAYITCLPLSAQKIVPTPEVLYSDAVEFMYSDDYSDALLVLLSLYDRGYSTANINYKIGECYLNIQGQKEKAIPFLKEAVKNPSHHYEGTDLTEEYAPYKAFLYLGIAYRLNNDFENALINFNQFLDCYDETEKDNRRLAEFHIERCNFARELILSPAKFTADTLSDIINNNSSNFNALVTRDEKVIYYMNQLKFYDAVMHAVKADQSWMMPENLTPLIKSDGDHYITGISPEGTQLFLTSYDPYHTGEIYTSSQQDGEWTVMHKLNGHINTRFNETHASMSPDGNILYFTSDRKGGYGGSDIYKSARDVEGDWDEPVNLGPLINTPFNEETPFISPDSKKLFFSSQGHYNMGGYDIFYSSLDKEGNWLPPVNIGYPLNTTDDDLFFLPLDTGNIAYQSKYSTSSAQMDIIRLTIQEYGKPARFIINGKIELEADPGYDPSGISITFIDRIDNDTIAVKRLNEDGSFRQKLPGGAYLLDFSENTTTLLRKNLDIPDYFPHNNLVFHDRIVITHTIRPDTLYVSDIRFDFNASKVNETDIPELVKDPRCHDKISGSEYQDQWIYRCSWQ
jgi:hypothetical protein